MSGDPAGHPALSVLAVTGWGEDERVWGDLLDRLGTRYAVSRASAYAPCPTAGTTW